MSGPTRNLGDIANLPTDVTKSYNWTPGTGWTVSASGLVNFTESLSTTAPNDTVPVVALKAVNAAANADLVLAPVGTGAVALAVADNATAGGNKRGANAIDLQTLRTAATQVASGSSSVAMGARNTASGTGSTAIGTANIASGSSSVALGAGSTASGAIALALGNTTTSASGGGAVALGSGCVASATYSFAQGQSCVADGVSSRATGRGATARGMTGAQARQSHVASAGVQQDRSIRLVVTTSGTGAVALTADGGATPSVTNTLNMVANSTYYVKGNVTARDSSGNSAAWEVSVLTKMGTTASTIAIVGTPVITVIAADSAASAWAPTITVDTTIGTVNVNGAGSSSTTAWTFTGISVETVL